MIFLHADRFACEWLLVLWKWCMLGPPDWVASGLFFLQKTLWMLCFWSVWFRTVVSHYTLDSRLPLLSTHLLVHTGCSDMARAISNLSLVSHYTLNALSALVRTCLPVFPTTLWILCPHPAHTGWSEWFGPHFAFVSHLSPLRFALRCSEALSAVVRVISGLAGAGSAGLPLHSGCFECFGPHDVALVSHYTLISGRITSGISPICLRLSPNTLDAVGACLPAVSHCTLTCSSCLPLHSGFSVRVIFLACLPLVS